MEPNKALRMLGLATRAGKVITGVEQVKLAVKNQKAYLVILAEDAKKSTAKEFMNILVPTVKLGDKLTLGKMTGKEIRSAVAVTDKNFAEVILKEAGNKNVTEN